MKTVAFQSYEFTKVRLTTLLSLSALLIFQATVCGLPSPAAVFSEDKSLSQELSLPVYAWKTPDYKPKGIVVAIHGMTLHARRFDSFANHLADDGFEVYACDLRGFGSRQDLPKHVEGKTAVHYKYSQDDLVGLISLLKRTYPDVPLFCVGESLGANMAICIAADHPELVSGVIASSPCIKRFSHWSPRMLVDVTKSLIEPYRFVPLEPYVANHLSEDPRVVNHYKSDPLIRKQLTVAELLKSLGSNKRTIDAMKRLQSNMPVLIVAGAKDRIYDASVLKKFVRGTGTTGAELHVVKDKGHLLLEHAYIDPGVLKLIDGWFDQTLTRRQPLVTGRSPAPTPAVN